MAALLACLACSRVVAKEQARAGADASAGPIELTRDDVCALVDQLAHLRVGDRPRSSIIDQPCTKELAGVSGKIAIDVLAYRPEWSVGRRLLKRGETCGTADMVVTCDPGNADQKCPLDPAQGENWKLVFMLHSQGSDRVRGHATTVRYKPIGPGVATASPCGKREAVFERSPKGWAEVPRGDHSPPTPRR
jgi:hypothetical protein